MKLTKLISILILTTFIFSQDHEGHDHEGHDHGKESQDYDPKQGGYVRGSVIDDIMELPKPYANISIVKADSDKIIQGGVADEDGLFFIDKIPYGTYYAAIEYVGFEKYIIDDVKIYPTHLEVSLGEIRLISKALILDGVEVVDKMPVIEDIAKTTYPVAETARAEGGSADDVLEKIPSVSINSDGAVTLRGDPNVTILIDGRKSKMDVNTINANMIEKVEVMTTPSSKYDPDGIAGIINIVLNKNEYVGNSGNLGINIDDKESVNFSGSLNSFNNDWNIFGSYSLKSRNKEGEKYRNTSIFDDNGSLFSSNQSEGVTDNSKDNANIKLGFERYFKNNDLLAFDITFLKHKHIKIEDDQNTYNNTASIPAIINELSTSLIQEEGEGSDLNFGIGYFKNNDNKGSELSIQLDYEDHDDKETINYTLASSNPSIKIETEKDAASIFAVDYSSSFSKDNDKENFEVGLKVNSDVGGHDLDYNGEPFEYNHDNKIMATYFNATYGVSEHLDMQIGVRLEHQKKTNTLTFDDGNIDCTIFTESECNDEAAFCSWNQSTATCHESDFSWALDLVENKDYTYEHKEGGRVFPSIYFIYDLEDAGTIKFSGARRINRPWYRNLSPIPDISETGTGIKFIDVGNPLLIPEDILKSEIQYSNKVSIGGFPIGFMKATAYYEDISDKIDRDKDTEIDPITSEVYQILSYDNNSKSRKVGFELMFATQMQKFSMMIQGRWWNEKTWGAPEADGLGTDHGFFGNIVGELNFKNDQKISMYAHHSSPMKITTGTIKPFRRMDLTYKKEINQRFNFTIKLKDVFDTGGFSIETSQLIYDDLGNAYNETLDANYRRGNRTLSMNFEYKFGSFQKKKYKREDGHAGHSHGDEGGGMDMGY